MQKMDPRTVIADGDGILGIELGSTRIKATLISPDAAPIAHGSYTWENRFENGVWTYDMDDVHTGLSACYRDLVGKIEMEHGITLSLLAGVGISGMMHGYIAIDDRGKLLVPFRTWRNTITSEASERLTELFNFPVPQRWSIAHLYQAILNCEEHVTRIKRITTLAGYVHFLLTGKFVIGMNDASGMFPVDPQTGSYYSVMAEAFDEAVRGSGVPWKVRDILPEILKAGTPAGKLSGTGVSIIDSANKLQAGIPLCPPEGDAGTGMVATNSLRKKTGNVSAGTSVFAMVVLESPLEEVHTEIDVLVTPDGSPVAMAHSNNCTSDLDAWMSLFHDTARYLGHEVSLDFIYKTILPLALEGEPDAGGVLTYGYVSGEHMTGFEEGRPLLVRDPAREFLLPNLIRAHLFSALGAMRIGLDILTENEGVTVEEIRGHGGFFKAPGVGQRIMAAATAAPVRLQETAGEGGSWGMALLAAYMVHSSGRETLVEFVDDRFNGTETSVVEPDVRDVEGFRQYFDRYTRGLPIERAAVEALRG
ncbi:FGGY-family carbohydrate kinase [Marispirochaeta aestuarii]|uniref:xylulokinase n=1 Tax=Marispirochaeta aestuarii TaxID=1963862 RepID=UPI0029C94A53|nr:FGGY-family carbohydrate kinase [Marispirochaeta aestuarii]